MSSTSAVKLALATDYSSAGPNWLDIKGHVCGLFNSVDEHYRVLMPFIKDGFDRGERACHTVDPARKSEHVERMKAAGIDVDAATASGQLALYDWKETFGSVTQWDNMRIVGVFRTMCDEGRRLGFPRTRFVCESEHAKVNQTIDELLEYEAVFQAHSFPIPEEDDIVICCYRIPEWSGDVLVNALRTHPLVILGGHLHENPFYERPENVIAYYERKRAQKACC